MFQYHLVNDPRTRFPETHAVLVRGRGQEVVHLLVAALGDREILDRPDLGANQMVAVHGGRHRRLRPAGGHELENRHLRRRILHRHAIRVQQRRCLAARGQPLEAFIQVRKQNLFRQRQRTTHAFTHGGHAGRQGLIVMTNGNDRVGRGFFHLGS